MKITREEIRRLRHGRRLTVVTLVEDGGDWPAAVTVSDPRASTPLRVQCGRDGSGRTYELCLTHVDALTLIVKLRDAVAELPND